MKKLLDPNGLNVIALVDGDGNPSNARGATWGVADVNAMKNTGLPIAFAIAEGKKGGTLAGVSVSQVVFGKMMNVVQSGGTDQYGHPLNALKPAEGQTATIGAVFTSPDGTIIYGYHDDQGVMRYSREEPFADGVTMRNVGDTVEVVMPPNLAATKTTPGFIPQSAIDTTFRDPEFIAQQPSMIFSSSAIAMMAGDHGTAGALATADDGEINKVLRQEAGDDNVAFARMWSDAMEMRFAEQVLGYQKSNLTAAPKPYTAQSEADDIRASRQRDTLLQHRRDEAAGIVPTTLTEDQFRSKARGILMAANPLTPTITEQTVKTETVDGLRALVAAATGTAMTDVVGAGPSALTPPPFAGPRFGGAKPPATLGGSLPNLAPPPPPPSVVIEPNSDPNKTPHIFAPPPPPPPTVVIEPNEDPNKTPHIYAPPPAPNLAPNYNIKNPGDKHR
jgi:hypothetical protein